MYDAGRQGSMTCRFHKATLRGLTPFPAPGKAEAWATITAQARSAFIDKDSHEHFEIRTHNRLIDVLDPDSKTIDMLMRLNLPAGVDIVVK